MSLPITAESTEFITLAELKAHLNKTTDADDAELETFRAAAERHVEGKKVCGPILWRQVTQTSRGCALALHTLPVLSVETVDGVAATGYIVDVEAGIVEGLPSGVRVPVVYTVGRTECDDDIRLATLIIGKHLWETQRGRASNRAGNATEGEQVVPMGYLIPHRAAALLAPHMLTVGFA